MSTVAEERERNGPKLRRALTLWDLVLYGIILIQPTAPMPVFGVVSQEARGHVVTTILIAMIAMLFTAISYGRMARAYPSAGSAFTYVGRELHPGLGFVTGWSMTMDYLLNPILCIIWCSKAAGNIIPEIPFAMWVLFFAALFTALNLRGVRVSRSWFFHAAVLQPGDLFHPADLYRHFDCGADLYRLRWNLNPL